MLSPRDWIERLRQPRVRETVPSPPGAVTRPASLPDILDLPEDVREVLLDLERRGQLRRALRMAPARAALASRLAELVEEHGADAFLEALALIDLGAAGAGEPAVPSAPLEVPRPLLSDPPAAVPAATPSSLPEVSLLAGETVELLGNLNVNQWRGGGRNTDGWYAPGPGGRPELFVVRGNVPPTLLKELSNRGIVLADARGVKGSDAMTFAIRAGNYNFKSVLALDLDKLEQAAGAPFADIHARWDGAEKKYPVTVLGAKLPPEPPKDEVTHEPVG